MSGLKAEDNTKLVSADSGHSICAFIAACEIVWGKKEKEKTRILPVKLANFCLPDYCTVQILFC